MPELNPVAEVSEETFSSDGTSDIITRNLPIGTKLYAIPAGHVVVPRELLERLYSSDTATALMAAAELRALLNP